MTTKLITVGITASLLLPGLYMTAVAQLDAAHDDIVCAKLTTPDGQADELSDTLIALAQSCLDSDISTPEGLVELTIKHLQLLMAAEAINPDLGQSLSASMQTVLAGPNRTPLAK